MKVFRNLFVVAVLATLLGSMPGMATGTTGGGAVDLTSENIWVAEITYADTVAAAKVQLPVERGEPYAYWTSEGFPAVSIVLTEYVAYGDGSTIDPDGIFIGSGLDDPLFVNLGALTTTWECEFVVVAAGTMKSRITAADAQDPVGKIGAYGDYTDTIAIPTAVYANGAGLGVDFNAAGGHTIGDRWLVRNYADAEYLGATAGQISTTRADLDGAVVCPVIFLYQPYELTY